MIKNFENWLLERVEEVTGMYETLPEYYERMKRLRWDDGKIGDTLEIGGNNEMCLQFFSDFYKSIGEKKIKLKDLKDALVMVHSQVDKLPWADEKEPNRLYAIIRSMEKKFSKQTSMSTFNQTSYQEYYMEPFPICKTGVMSYILQKEVADKLIHDNRAKIYGKKYSI